MFNLLLLSFFFSLSSCCITPTGIGTGLGELSLIGDNIDLSAPVINRFFTVEVELLDQHEPTIEFRILHWQQVSAWNILSTYEEKPLDFFGRLEITKNRRKCRNNPLYVPNSDLWNEHRLIAYGYLIYFVNVLWLPKIIAEYDIIMNSINLDPNICNKQYFNCSDISTPWGSAYTLSKEVFEYSLSDGWNSDGSYNRQYNRIPYQDWRDKAYIPKNNPWKLRHIKKWQPLLEHDGLGFLFHQEHLHSHIGFTGRLMFLNTSYFCSLSAPDPKYNYEKEIDLTFNRMRKLTDKQKIEVELFDIKSDSIALLAFQYYIRLGLFFDWSFFVMNSVLNGLLYEASMVVWRQKILHDLIRPPSLIHELRRDKYVYTYAGVDETGRSLGNKRLLGQDWEPYIRTMPHAEYPSGSACICKAFEVAFNTFLGKDDVTEALGGPLVLEFASFSSRIEPLSTPKQNLTLVFDSWSNIAKRCSQSRLDGGMHFTASIKAGEDLCANVGRIVAEGVMKLNRGELPDTFPDFNDRTLKQEICQESESSESKKPRKSSRGVGGRDRHGRNSRSNSKRKSSSSSSD